jgi:hypothetical protein
LLKHGLFTVLAFVSFFSIVGVVFGNPIPWDPGSSLLNLDPIQYFFIVIAEFCSLVVGTSILVHKCKAQWHRAAITTLVALIASFAIGIIIWTNLNPANLVVLLMPEFTGVAVGTLIIQKAIKTIWKTAFITMTAAMLTSFLFSILIANVYLRMI